MKRLMIFSFLLFFLTGIIFTQENARSEPDLSIYTHLQTRELVQLVYDAVYLIQEKGKAAYPQFRVKDSKWYYDDTYIFVWGMDGMRYVYPRDVSVEGRNMLELKDINGKPIGKMFTETAEKGEGWVFYEWTIPGNDTPQWKATFIKKAVSPEGTELLVGCGLYNMPLEKVLVQELVIEAAQVLKEEGLEAASARFSSKADRFIFQDVYVFINNIYGEEIFNPYKAELDSNDYIQLQEEVTRYYMEEIKPTLIDYREAWMMYRWPKPDSGEMGIKETFLKAVMIKNELLVIGAGYYTD